jgi:hypothetical protein
MHFHAELPSAPLSALGSPAGRLWSKLGNCGYFVYAMDQIGNIETTNNHWYAAAA